LDLLTFEMRKKWILFFSFLLMLKQRIRSNISVRQIKSKQSLRAFKLIRQKTKGEAENQGNARQRTSENRNLGFLV
jgi:hypothetical protein